MTALRVAWLRLVAVFRRGPRERQLGDEIQTHLEFLADEYVRAGMSLEQARAAARRSFGGVEQMKERFRDQHRWAFVDALVHDARFAVRLLAKDRRFTLGAVLALALGISVNNMVFTFVNAVVLRDLPLANPEQLVAFNTRDARGREAGVSYPDYVDWTNGTHDVFSDTVALVGRDMNLSDDDRAPERFRGSYVAGNVFRMYGMPPVVGRGFTPDDHQPGAPSVVILNDRVWQSRYGTDPILGRTIRVNGVPSTVVGIMPAAFKSPLQNDQVLQPLRLLSDLPLTNRDARILNVDGRLRDGVSLDQATAVLNTIGADLSQQYPQTNGGVTPTIAPLSEIYKGALRPVLAVLMIAVAFVLLIACANVANLLLARSAVRSREIALRVSLGATRWRIVRQLLIESVVLALLGGLLGLVLSLYEVKAFSIAFNGKEVGGTELFAPFWLDLSMDWRVFGFLAALCLGSSIVFGLAPALHVSKSDTHDIMKDGGRGAVGNVRARGWASALVVAQLVLALVLLTGAGLMVRSAIAAYKTSLAFDTSDLFTMRLALPTQTYRTAEDRTTFLLRLEERLKSSPATMSVTLASNLPLVPGGKRMQMSVNSDHPPAPGQPLRLVTRVDIGPRYFETLRVPLLRGRSLSEPDVAGSESGVVVNQRLAAIFFPDVDPIGHRIYLTDSETPTATASSFTIDGVSPTLPQYTFPQSPGRMPDPVVYVPLHLEAAPDRVASIIVRGQSGLDAATSQMRELMRTLDPDLPLYFIRTMDDVADEMRYPIRMMSVLFGLLAGIAFVLASIGLYAVTAHAVTQRTAEIGIRVALGAKTLQVMWLFLRRTMVQVGIGLVLGLAGALSVGNVLRGLLVQTDARDPLTLISVGMLLVLVSLAACALPTWRATRLSPVDALRHE